MDDYREQRKATEDIVGYNKGRLPSGSWSQTDAFIEIEDHGETSRSASASISITTALKKNEMKKRTASPPSYSHTEEK